MVTPAAVTMASAQRIDSLLTEVRTRIQESSAGLFETWPLVAAAEGLGAGLDWGWLELNQGDTGIAASMPEWSPAPVGWLYGKVFEAALSL